MLTTSTQCYSVALALLAASITVLFFEPAAFSAFHAFQDSTVANRDLCQQTIFLVSLLGASTYASFSMLFIALLIWYPAYGVQNNDDQHTFDLATSVAHSLPPRL